jgi:hypothetical protein
MVNLWISVSLLGLTGWQGYRLGREYGWWGRAQQQKPHESKDDDAEPPLSDSEELKLGGLGHSKTDFSRLLMGYQPATAVVPDQNGRSPVAAVEINEQDDEPVTEPTTTLMDITEDSPVDEYPEETDQIPSACTWMDSEDVPLMADEDQDDKLVGESVVELSEYVKRVRTVQRKLNQLSQRRQTDSTFLKQDLGLLIQTYQLDNDQSLDWLFQQQGESLDNDYGSVFDRIERHVS